MQNKITNDIVLFPIRLLEAMKDNGLNQSRLSKITGINKATISQYLAGNSKPNKKYAEILSDFLFVNKDWLLGGDIPKHFGLIDRNNVFKTKLDNHSTDGYFRQTLDFSVYLDNENYINKFLVETAIKLARLNINGIEKISDLIDDLSEIDKYKKDAD